MVFGFTAQNQLNWSLPLAWVDEEPQGKKNGQ